MCHGLFQQIQDKQYRFNQQNLVCNEEIHGDFNVVGESINI